MPAELTSAPSRPVAATLLERVGERGSIGYVDREDDDVRAGRSGEDRVACRGELLGVARQERDALGLRALANAYAPAPEGQCPPPSHSPVTSHSS